MKSKCLCGHSTFSFSYEMLGRNEAGVPLGKCCIIAQANTKKPAQEEPNIPSEVSIPTATVPAIQTPDKEITPILTPLVKWFTECGFQPTSRNLYSVPALRLYTAYKNWLVTHLPNEKVPSITRFGLLMNSLCQKQRKPSGQFYFVQREPN
jgi:hypothetical protein